MKLTSLIALAAIAASLGLSSCSSPDNDDAATSAELAWLDNLDASGIDYGTNANGVELARAACDLYAEGPDSASSIFDFFEAEGLNLFEAGIAALSIPDAC